MARFVEKSNFGGEGYLFFGVEHEVSMPSGSALDSFEHEDDKGELVLDYGQDCSVHRTGLEYRTKPCTLQMYKCRKWEIAERMRLLTKHGGEAHNTAGIHVHISRDAFTPAHLYRFSKFVRDNEDALRKFAGRGRCAHNDRGYSGHDDAWLKRITGKFESVGRGLPNLGLQHTVEMRIFASTLSEDVYLANIEYCHGLYMYTKFAELSDMSWSDFSTFMLSSVEYDEFNRTHQVEEKLRKGELCV